MRKVIATAVLFLAIAVPVFAQRQKVTFSTADRWELIPLILTDQRLDLQATCLLLDFLEATNPGKERMDERKHIIELLAGKLFGGVENPALMSKKEGRNFSVLGTEGYEIVVSWDEGLGNNFRTAVLGTKERVEFDYWFIYYNAFRAKGGPVVVTMEGRSK